ncbi:hypothetical protein BDM02DRAFT_3133247 [Thelephora ganbajun]|uniref:Uncharacterized protein n=1 Tax=Thelephora ganbajun TaxID=370292 RepID=A0ACB6YYP7_THEGA|nr:hypothetical protein BDM02DRAFT_3133247 [Thelephora ganbajun]
MNQDHTCRGWDMRDDERVLFNLVSARLIDPQEFDELHKWSSRSIWYLAIVADRLWALYEAEHTRNNCVEAKVNALKGQVSLLSSHLLAIDRYSFDANKKVNAELEKDGDKHNALVTFVVTHLTELELHCQGLSPIGGSGAAPSFESMPELTQETESAPAVEVALESPVIMPVENVVPIPIHPPCPIVPRTMVESSTTLQSVSEEEGETEDRIIRAWQGRGADNTIPITLTGLELSESSGPSCTAPVVEVTWEQLGTRSPEARGYRMLSVMRAVTLMPNVTVSACLLSSDLVEFDSLLSRELEAEVRPIVEQEVVRSGAQDNDLEYFEE